MNLCTDDSTVSSRHAQAGVQVRVQERVRVQGRVQVPGLGLVRVPGLVRVSLQETVRVRVPLRG